MKLNIASNYAQQAVNIGLRFFMIPVYVEAFGISGYGLIGFYITLSSLFVLLDFGMGYGAIKILSENSASSGAGNTAVLRIVELVYLLCALAIGLSVYFLSEFIAHNWLTVDADVGDTILTIQLIAVLLFVNWPQSLYQSFMVGQERFVVMNAVLITGHISVALVLFFCIKNYDLNVSHYFLVMAALMFLQTAALRYFAWSKLQAENIEAVSLDDLRRFFSYAAGVSVVSLCSLGFFQGPTLVLSYFAPTSELGLYNLAMTFPMAFITLMYPLGSVFLPKLTQITKNGAARDTFESATFIMGGFVVTGTIALLFNMQWVYGFWLGKLPDELVSVSSSLAFATLFYGLAMAMNSVLIINGATKQLATAYIVALLWFAFEVFQFGGEAGAQTVADLWRSVSFVLMCGVLLAGLVSFPSLVRGWLKNIGWVLLLGSIGVYLVALTTSHVEASGLFNVVASLLILASLYGPKLYRVVKSL